MARTVNRVLIIVLIYCSSAFAQRKVAEEAVIFNAVKDGVFTVFGDRGQGSGFLVDSSGLILTNSHVITQSTRISVQIDDTTRVPALLLEEDKTKDIAVLSVSPEAVRLRPVLKIADREAKELAFEGEKVIAIGSPLSQKRIVTSGIVSKVEERAIISDVNINPGNSGGPLLNMDSEVIAINTFGESARSGPGISGSVSISEAMASLTKARKLSQAKAAPPLLHLPVSPKDAYPLWGLKWASKRCHKHENYQMKLASRIVKEKKTEKSENAEGLPSYQGQYETPNFDIVISTPTRKFYISSIEEQKLAKKREKREKAAGASEAEKYDPVGDFLKEWAQYVGEYAPLVMVQVFPKIGETGGSFFANLLGAVGAGMAGVPYYGSHAYEFKGDLRDFELMNADATIPEVVRMLDMVPVSVKLTSVQMEDVAQWGVFQYLPYVFASYDSEDLHVKIKDLKKPDKVYDVIFPRACLEQIWVDFEPYRDMIEAKNAKLLVKEGHEQ
jgi:S1-C subfamily serine protease